MSLAVPVPDNDAKKLLIGTGKQLIKVIHNLST